MATNSPVPQPPAGEPPLITAFEARHEIPVFGGSEGRKEAVQWYPEGHALRQRADLHTRALTGRGLAGAPALVGAEPVAASVFE